MVLSVSIALMTVLSPIQMSAAGFHRNVPSFVRNDLFLWRLAVLGPKIGQDHPEYDSIIFPSAAHDRFVQNARYAAEAAIGPYRSGWLSKAGVVKYDPSLRDDARCVGQLDAIQDGQARGWLVAKRFEDGPTLVVLTRGDETVGYGVTGDRRPDVAKAVVGAPDDAGWRGFASTSDVTDAYAYLGERFCRLTSPAKL